MKVVALAGGTGGAKLAHGLQAVLPAGDLTVVVNTGDDTERHGLLVMPDHDAVLYMLAGRFDDERGWGVAARRGPSWTSWQRYGEEDWFRLGDRDFATHIARGARLREAADADRGGARRSRRALGIADADPADGRRAGADRRSASTRAGSTSRSTSSIATRSPRSARSATPGSTPRRPTAEVAEAAIAAPT